MVTDVRLVGGRVCRVSITTSVLLALSVANGHADPLTSFEHQIVGARLQVEPPELYVPKDIPGSILVNIATSAGARHPNAAALARGKHIRATLRGPAFPAFTLFGLPGEPLVLPPLALAGEYEIADVRLVDTLTGEVRATFPTRVPVHVFPEVLVSQVVSRPLTIDEVQAKGIVIDAANFSAVEFEVTFTLQGRPFPVRFPVVTPKFRESTEIIPRAEVEEKLAVARELNERLATQVSFPPELELPGLDLQVKPVNFESVTEGEGEDLARRASIPGLVVIPGSIGFLNRFFSVKVYTANAAPAGSPLEVHHLEAEIQLPFGRDRVLDTPDDPLAFARVGPDAQIFRRIELKGVGPDGVSGTSDDAIRLAPGQTGEGEFLIEGRKEGLQTFDIQLSGILDGLVAGELPIRGTVSGSVLIRNPKFSIVFSHPAAVQAGEPYQASVTVLNTSETPADLVSVHLSQASLSGARFDADQAEDMGLGTLGPGEASTADFRLVAERTGFITLSNLTGDDGLTGRFDLKLAVDERGVPFSGQVILYPTWVRRLPAELKLAADRVLGRALAVASAALLPPGVRRVELETVRTRVVELAEAGQRLAYGDTPERVYLDLLLDWYGGRTGSRGFDQILRETTAGSALRSALFGLLPGTPALAWLEAAAPDLAGRGEAWGLAAASDPGVTTSLLEDGASTTAQAVIEAGADPSHALAFAKDPGARASDLEVVFRIPAGNPSATFGWVTVNAGGGATIATWPGSADPLRDTCHHYFPSRAPDVVTIDPGCAGASAGETATSIASIGERPPQILSVTQDLSVRIERPDPFCYGPHFTDFDGPNVYQNYGTLLTVLFSKPMAAASLEAATAFSLDNGVQTAGIKLQPGGRVALVNLRSAIAAWRPRTLEVAPEVHDPRGHGLTSLEVPIVARADKGVSINGVVIGTTGEPVPFAPVTLTMNDMRATRFGCLPVDVRSSQVFTDQEGRFNFDFVMSGIGYTLGATDVRGLSPRAVSLLLETATQGELDPAEIQLLASTPEGLQRLLEAFQAGSAAGAVALAEGVDRAVFRDFVDLASPRIGSEVPVALRFRGRGTVTGTVVLADELTPVAGAAVNLFPDQASREKGRGAFTDGSGHFAFYGVPLGAFSLDARSSDGLARTVAGRLETPGQRAAMKVVLSETPIPVGGLTGTVYEPDGTTPHPNADVFVRNAVSHEVLGATKTNAEGGYTFVSIPAIQVELIAISSDGNRSARRLTTVQAESVSVAYLSLPGTAVVVGRVELANGSPAAGALVAGGEAVVTTDAGGLFTLTGVPTGRRTLHAGLETDFVRLGSSTIDVLPGVTNSAVIRFPSLGRIQGRVLDAAGQPLPFLRVMVPRPGGFLWTVTDGGGRYSFGPLGLGTYEISAAQPSYPVTEPLETDSALGLGSREALEAAFAQAVELYASGGAPQGTAAPTGFGSTMATLNADGQTTTADVHFLPAGRVAGRVENHLGVPIGAEVALSALALNDVGHLNVEPRGGTRSDPATGAFAFGQVPVGPYNVVATSPFYGVQVSARGQTTLDARDATGIVLAFPPPVATGARITGRVLRDGAPAGAGVRVAINFGTDYEIQTTADGTFDTQIDLPARSYQLRALDPSTGRVGFAEVLLRAGIPASIEIPLLSVTAGIDVHVRSGDGQAVSGASVVITRAGQPPDSRTQSSDSKGDASFSNLVEGTYAVSACQVVSQVQLCARTGVTLAGADRAAAELVLQDFGTITGTYVEADGSTPIGFAQVAVGNIAFSTTDASGRFSVQGIPLGTYKVTAKNAVSGRAASAQARLSTANQVVEVFLREAALGAVRGTVTGSDGTTPMAATPVTLDPQDPLFPSTLVTTDPGGGFLFPGVPPGSFTLIAVHPSVRGLLGRAEGTMPSLPEEVQVDVHLAPRASLVVTVLDSDGTPAFARVSLGTSAIDTDMLGQATFTELPLGTKTIFAQALSPGRARSRGQATVALTLAGPAPGVTVRLLGVGSVRGTLLTSLGAPVSGAEVFLDTFGSPGAGTDHDLAITDPDGRFSFEGVAVAPVRARGISGALMATASGTVAMDGDVVELVLHLTPSADVIGVLVRADGTTRVPNADLVITYRAPSGLSGAVKVRTSSIGAFRFTAIPEGSFVLEGAVPWLLGVLHFEGLIPPLAGTVDLGPVALDEAPPFVIGSDPADGETVVPVGREVTVTFSEPMDTSFADLQAVYLADPSGAHVPADLRWASSTVLALAPRAPLASATAYSLVVLGPRVFSPSGSAIGPGPTDLAGRVIDVPFVARFTTIDATPPLVLSFTPENGAVAVDPSEVVRISFTKPIVPASVVVTLVDSAGVSVPAAVAMGLDDRLLVVTPSFGLLPNSSYRATLHAASDRSGNALLGVPMLHWFETLDTIGPAIADLSLVGVSRLTAGAQVSFLATLSVPEAGVAVQGSTDLRSYAGSAPGALTFSLKMPGPGPVAIFARAVDRFGNFGPTFQKTFEVVENLPPILEIAQLLPATGALRSGQPFEIRVSAIDDSRVVEVTASARGAGLDLLETVAWPAVLLSGVLPESLGPGELLTVEARATDDAGLVATATPAAFAVGDGVPPAASVTSLGAPSRPGELLRLTLELSDTFDVSSYALEVLGAVTYSESQALAGAPTSFTRVVELPVPVSAPSGAPIWIRLTATDLAGNIGEGTLELSVADFVPPSVVALSPPNGAAGIALSTSVTVQFSEGVFGVDAGSFLLLAAGAPVSGVVTLSTDQRSATLMPLSALLPSTSYTVALSSAITDAAGNPLAPMESVFRTADVDLLGPRLLAIRPAATSTGVVLNAAIELELDEAVNRASVSRADLVFEPALGGAAISVTLAFAADDRILRFVPAELRPGTSYRATMGGAPRDAVGNLARDSSGGPWSGATTTFTTASITLALFTGLYDSPNRVVEGHALVARILADPKAPLFAGDWYFDSQRVGTSYGPVPAWTYAAPLPARTFVLSADAYVKAAGKFPLPAEVVTVEPRTADFDGDGLTNEVEATFGTNPWEADATDDPDADLLSNAAEIAAGTDPHVADSDDDGIPDGSDPAPLAGKRPPGIFVSSPAETRGALTFDGTGSRGLSLPSGVLPSAPWSLEVWARPTAAGDVLGSSFDDGPINLGYDAAGHFSVSIRTTFGPPLRQVAPLVSQISAWHHLAVTYDGARARLFVDGLLSVDAPLTGELDPGAPPIAVGTTFAGSIDELRVWSYARTAGELSKAMFRRLGGTLAGLLGAWPLEAPATGEDATGQGRTAVVTNAAGTVGAPVYAERSFPLTGASQAFNLGNVNLDGDPVTYEVTRLPLHGQLLGSGGTPITALGATGPGLTYGSDPAFAGTDEVEVIARSSGLVSLPLAVRFVTPDVKTWVGASALRPSAWDEADNWSPASVPAPTDRVQIPAGAASPVVLEANASIASLYVGDGAILTLSNAANLTVAGSVASDGAIGGDGALALTGSGTFVRGRVPSLRVSSAVRVNGALDAQGDVTVNAFGALTIGGQTVQISGALRKTGGRLVMKDDGDRVDVGGEIYFTTGFNTGDLSAGVLRGHAGFTVEGTTWGLFRASGTHRVELVGPVATVRLDYAGASWNFFQDLTVTSPLFVLTKPASPADATSWLWVAGVLHLGDGVQSTMLATSGGIDAIGGVTVEEGSRLACARLAAGALDTISGTLIADELVLVSNGTSVIDWTPLPGHTLIHNLTITRHVLLLANLSISGDLTIPLYGHLTINGHTVAVGGALNMSGGSLLMMSAGDLVDVQGPISWSKSFAAGRLIAGVLRGHSAFSVEGYSPSLFEPSGTHTVQLVGPTASIRMDYAGQYTNRFQHLVVTAPELVLTPPTWPNPSLVWLATSGDFTLGDGTRATTATFDGEVHVGGGAIVEAGSSLTATKLVAGRVASSGMLAPSSLVLVTDGNTTFDWAPDPSHYVLVDVELQRPVNLIGDLPVLRDLSIPVYGKLTVNDHNVTVGRDLGMAGGGLVMASPASFVGVARDIRWTVSFGAGALSAGVLEGHGRFLVEGTNGSIFRAAGSHTVRLIGPVATIRLDYAGALSNRLQNLEVMAQELVLEQPASPFNPLVWLKVMGDFRLGDDTAASSANLSGRVEVGGTVAVGAGSALFASVLAADRVESAGMLAPAELILSPASTAPFDWNPDPRNFALQKLTLSGPVRLTGNLALAGELALPVSGKLTVNNRAVSVGGALSMSGGALVMTSTAALVDVAGDISFTAGSPSSLTGGVLRGHGGFSAAGNVTSLFRASGKHRVELVGPTALIRMDRAGTSGNHFQDLWIFSPSATLVNPSYVMTPPLTLHVVGSLGLFGSEASGARLDIAADQTAEVGGALVLGPLSVLDNQGTPITPTSCTFDPTAVATGVTCP